jgi:hypothetical protein
VSKDKVLNVYRADGREYREVKGVSEDQGVAPNKLLVNHPAVRSHNCAL